MTLHNYSENYLSERSIEKHFNSLAQIAKESTKVTQKEFSQNKVFFLNKELYFQS